MNPMKNRNEPKFIPNIFSPEECKEIISVCSTRPMTEGPVYKKDEADKYQQLVDVNIRNAHNYAFNDTDPKLDWIRDRLRVASREINNDWYEFDLTTTLPDRLAFVHYPLGGFFAPHVDNLGGNGTLYKKLTCVVQLSDPSTYEGGRLRLAPDFGEMPIEQGTMITFPTYVRHMVEPVTKGERFILVNWCVSETHFK